jgi:RNA polymerase primary sigma factor
MSVAEIIAAVPETRRKQRAPRSTAKSIGVHEPDRDILDQYLHEVSLTPLLTQPQEIAIARRVQAGDEDAMQELVKRNLRFVISVAKKYQNRDSRPGGPDRREQRRPSHRGPEVRPRSRGQVHFYAVWWIAEPSSRRSRGAAAPSGPLNRTADLSASKVSEACVRAAP